MQIRALCNQRQIRSFSNDSNTVNPDFLSDYIKGLLHLSQQRTNSADPIRDLTEVFLHQRRESNSDSSGRSEDKADDVPMANISDVLLSAAQVFAELGVPHGAVCRGLCLLFIFSCLILEEIMYGE